MEVGIDSFAALLPHPETGLTPSPAERMQELLREIELADEVGLDSFGLGEHHREEFLDAAPAVILAAAAARTRKIRLTSAVTVLSAADPVRVFQEFATLDLIARGRIEMVVGRGSFVEAFPLFGLELADYDDLFAEKLELLLQLREQPRVTWSGRFRPPLRDQPVFPRPLQQQLPIWLGVGGTPASFARAGVLGLPLMVAIIGGSFDRFAPLVQLYREAGRHAGHPADSLRVGLHAMGFVADSDEAARDAFFPGWARMMNKIGPERGFPPVTRGQFESMCGPGGAFLVGSPASVARKMEAASQTLGGVDRINFQMSSAAGQSDILYRSIQLLGQKVAPALRASASAGQSA